MSFRYLAIAHEAHKASKGSGVLSSSSETIAAGDGAGGVPSPAGLYEVPLAVLILVLYIVLGHSLELWKDHQTLIASRMARFPTFHRRGHKALLCTFHESGPAILLGVAVGLMMNYGAGQQFDFNADIFFYVVLPPIIFHQGYAFKKRNFFRYFHYIFSFGVLGSLIQFMVITALAYFVSSRKQLNLLRDDGVSIGLSLHECMLIASIFSAADEVATLSLIKQSEYPKLSAILFGEGVINDAISILLFHAVTTVAPPGTAEMSPGLTVLALLLQSIYLLITAAGVGMGSGLLISALLKLLPSLRKSAVRQTAILMLGGYFSFSIGEALQLSGVLAVFFCGLTLSHYAWHSLGEEAKIASKITSDTASMVAEAYCFAAIGLSVHSFDSSQWCFLFILCMIGVVMVARAVAIYGICLVGAVVKPKAFKLPIAEQNVLFFGGLVRGAISWAQAVQVRDAHRGVMATTTLGVILFTVVIFGAVMPFFTHSLTPEPEAEKNKNAHHGNRQRSSSGGYGHYSQTSSVSGSVNGGGHANSNGHHNNGTGSIMSKAERKEKRERRTTLHTIPSVGHIEVSTDRTPLLGLLNQSVGFGSTVTAKICVEDDSADRKGVVHNAWIHFDDRFMRPLFGGELHDPEAAAIREREIAMAAAAIASAASAAASAALHAVNPLGGATVTTTSTSAATTVTPRSSVDEDVT